MTMIDSIDTEKRTGYTEGHDERYRKEIKRPATDPPGRKSGSQGSISSIP